MKKRRYKTTAPKRRKTETTVRRHGSSAALNTKTAQLTRDRDEALEQQKATAEVLRVISSSPTEIQPVLDAIASAAARLLDVADADIMRVEGHSLVCVAKHGPSQQWPIGSRRTINRDWVTGRAVFDRATIQVRDLQAARNEFPEGAAYAKQYGHRTTLATPLLRQGHPIGAILLRRKKVRPFTDKQIELVSTFADQAVIAIENARLFEAEQQRTRELTESLEQQTATSEVLRVISSSPGDLEPVFQTMLQNAVRICEAKAGNIYRWEDAGLRLVTSHNAPAAFAEMLRRAPLRATANNPVGRMLKTKSLVHTADLAAQRPYIEKSDPAIVAAVDLGEVRTQLSVPLLKEGEFIGAITLWRDEVRPFENKQIELVQNFAAQAVIAIENARLLNELRQRTRELTESLEQQTATSEVLRIISSSPGELEPVFDAMLANATRLCDASYGTLWLHEGDGQIRAAAFYGDLPEAFRQQWGGGAVFRPSPTVPAARAMLSRKPVQLVDLMADQSYLDGDALAVAAVQVAGIRSIISVPMVKDDVAVGAMTIYCREVHPFTDKQIALVANFAAQAVIAIENTRLLSELRELLQQQTATADVLKTISRSTFDLQTVLDTLVQSAVQLCDAECAHIFRFADDHYHLAACCGYSREYEDYMRAQRILPGRHTLIGRVAVEGGIVHIPDVLSDPEYQWAEAQRLGRWRTMLGVPLLREGTPIGALSITRSTVRPFSDKQIELLSGFAAQAVIAIENTRLLSELRELLQQQTATADVLKVISSSPGELEPVFQAMLENATRLCEASYGIMWLREGSGFRSAALHGPLPAAYVERWRSGTLVHAGPDAPMMRVAETRKPVQVTDRMN